MKITPSLFLKTYKPRRVRRRSGEESEIVFYGGMYVEKNSAHGANVRAQASALSEVCPNSFKRAQPLLNEGF